MIKLSVVIAAAIAMAACKPYTLPAPAALDAEPVEVAGKDKKMKFGEYQLVGFKRGWTRGSGFEVMSVGSEKRRQRYEFDVARAGSRVASARCEFFASEKTLGAKGGWSVVLGEDAELACSVAFATDTVRLNIANRGEDDMAGFYMADEKYRVQGIGLNKIARAMSGPLAGFHIYRDEVPVASVQIINRQQVLLARSLDTARRDVLAPAIAALLLLDASIAEFD